MIMNAYLRFDQMQLWQIAGWTMLHFLWLGTLVGLAAGALRLLLRRASPNLRYVAATTTLAILASLPFGIAAWLVSANATEFMTEPPAVSHGSAVTHDVDRARDSIIELSSRHSTLASTSDRTVSDSAEGIAPDTDLVVSTTTPSESLPAPPNTRQSHALSADTNTHPELRSAAILERLRSYVPYLPWLWLIGTPITFALLATGVVGTRRLWLASQPVHDGPTAELLTQLATSLRIGKRVGLAVCDRIAAPILIGVLRPIILLPPAALTGWSPDEIEMVLLHELAHVRRWDNLINLMQRIIESLLFFHPVVWLVSTWIRREREACCDALVVNRTKRPHAYAELLLALAAQMPRSVLFQPAASSAMAAGPLRKRIRRILQLEDDPMLVSGKSLTIMLGTMLVAITLAVMYLPSIGQAEESITEDMETAETRDGDATLSESDDAVATEEVMKDSSDDENAIEAVTAPFQSKSIDRSESEVESRDTGSNQESKSPSEQRVLGTFPFEPYSEKFWEQFKTAIENARRSNLYVDLVRDAQQFSLVVARRPTEADWPEILGEPPRKDRVIAEKAWQRLGLKLVPSSALEKLEFDTFNEGGGMKILGGNVPKGLPLPAFLRTVGSTDVHNFDDLHNWLNDKANKLSGPVKVYAIAEGHDYLFEMQIAGEPQATDVQAQAYRPDKLSADKLELKSPDETVVIAAEDGRVAAQSASADDWPAGVDFASPKEKEISRRAWKELRLKIVTASDAELEQVRRHGRRGGLKLVDFEMPSSEGPFILTNVSAGGNQGRRRAEFGIVTNFDDLEKALDAIALQKPSHIDILGAAKDRGFGRTYRRPQSSAAVIANPKSRFPSLEDQKLADLAYKRLSLELEPIDENELRRVQALGYEGGLRITSAPSGMGPGGILVGLHVWPIKNLNDVATVLNREDLADLSPLKYYLVRPTQAGSMYRERPKDVVVTGRIPVQISNRPPKFPWDIDSAVSQPSASQPAARTPSSANATADSLAEPTADLEPEIPRYVLPSATEEDEFPKWPNQELPGLPSQAERKKAPRSAAVSNSAATDSAVDTAPTPPDEAHALVVGGSGDADRKLTSDKENLRYEGKTFDQWRDASRIELSTQRQAEAVQALAAFGANGYAREATEAILDMAAKHDFRSSASRESAEGQLKSAIASSFTARRGIDKAVAFPMIMERYERAPEAWRDFVAYLLERPVYLPASEVALIRPLLDHDDPEMRAAALESIYYSTPADSSELLAVALRDSDPKVVAKGLGLVSINESRIRAGERSAAAEFPMREYLELVLSAGQSHTSNTDAVRRILLNDLSGQSADLLLAALLEILDDPDRKNEHVLVIRAIGGIARSRRATALDSANRVLEKLFNESDNQQLRAAAAFALRNFDHQRHLPNQLIQEANDLPKDAREQLRRLIEEEENATW
jgi:beta-lactamase regulating signal transducer with metallopeptidase domain